ncbi:hypothetical protein [Caballeronia sp. S22]|uniref:hypothetical protein n=1 Tax=Caballeronia sp. S22 TaxID=3137182 RepID=UPI0035309ED0
MKFELFELAFLNADVHPVATASLTAVAVAFLAYYIVGQLRPPKDEDVPPAAPGA